MRAHTAHVAAVAIVGLTGVALAEDVTVTPYYPSPRGVYNELRTTGNVGIGTTTPTVGARLQVVGNSGGLIFRAEDAAGSATPFAIDQNSNTGIGVAAPAAKLHVVSPVGPVDSLRVDTAAEASSFVVHNNGSVTIGQGGLSIASNPAAPFELRVGGGILVDEGLPAPCPPPLNQGGLAFNEQCADTGVFSSADGELILYANNDPSLYIYNHPPARVTIDPHYPVGIGFRSTDPVPVQRLEVKLGNLQLDDGILRIQPGVHGKKIDLWGDASNTYAIGSVPFGLFMTTDIAFSFLRNTVYTSGVGPAALYVDVNGGSLGSGVTHVHDDLHVYGNARVDGALTVTGLKAFLIPHPLDPEHKRLEHAALEGPEAGVYYRGSAQLTEGRAIIKLPDYFEALTRPEGRTVLLTPEFAADEPVSQLAASHVADGKFQVRALDTQNPGQKFFWEVKAIRADVAPLEVERAVRHDKDQ